MVVEGEQFIQLDVEAAHGDLVQVSLVVQEILHPHDHFGHHGLHLFVFVFRKHPLVQLLLFVHFLDDIREMFVVLFQSVAIHVQLGVILRLDFVFL